MSMGIKVYPIMFLCIVALICTACQRQENDRNVVENPTYIVKIQKGSSGSCNARSERKDISEIDNDKKVMKADMEEQRDILEKEREKRIVNEDTSRVGGHETENTYYAIYPTTIVETDPEDKPDQFFIWEKEISITFPQIYYSNEYEEYDHMIETSVNHELFLQSLGNDDSFLFGRDMRELRKFVTDYEITKADDELISIKYEEISWSIFHANTIYMGITIDVTTGEKVALPELVTLEDNLVEQVESGKIEFISLWHEWEDVKSSVEAFNDFYRQGVEDYYSCYYLEEDAVNLLIPLMQGNAAYVILRIPLEE